MQKRIIRLLIILTSLGTLLAPCSFYASFANFNYQKNTISLNSDTEINVVSHILEYNLNDPANISVIDTFTIRNSLNVSINSTEFYFNETLTNLVVEEAHEISSLYNLTVIPDLLSNDYLMTIDFQTPLKPGYFREIKFRYNIEKEIVIFEKDYIISYFEFFRTHYTYYEHVTVILERGSEPYPKGGGIIPQESGIILHPTGFREIFWNFYNASKFTSQQIEVKFKPPEKNPVWIYIIGPFLGLAGGIGGTVWFMRLKGKKEIQEIGKIFLSDSEKLLLKLIARNNGKISQRELCTKTGYTKAKVSRNLISLEKQDLITREKWGRNYQVYSTDLGKKVIE